MYVVCTVIGERDFVQCIGLAFGELSRRDDFAGGVGCIFSRLLLRPAEAHVAGDESEGGEGKRNVVRWPSVAYMFAIWLTSSRWEILHIAAGHEQTIPLTACGNG